MGHTIRANSVVYVNHYHGWPCVHFFIARTTLCWFPQYLLFQYVFPRIRLSDFNINSVASIVSSILIGVTLPVSWLYCVMGTDEYNGANDLSMFPLSAAGSSLLYGIVGVPVIAVVLLLAYPIPF